MFGQSVKKIKEETISSTTYLRTGVEGATIFCGQTQIQFFHSNKRLILKSREISLDIKITSRKSDQWKGTDQITNNEYYIGGILYGEDYGVIIVPVKQDIGLLGVIMCQSKNLCED